MLTYPTKIVLFHSFFNIPYLLIIFNGFFFFLIMNLSTSF